MKKRNIVLIGPMGTGKSRAARILADGLDWQLADTDRIMEKETGMKMADYWRKVGAEEFQRKELEIIRRVRFFHEAVIAVGGNYPIEKAWIDSFNVCEFLSFSRTCKATNREKTHYGL